MMRKRKRKALSKKLRQRIYNKYNGHCAYCGKAIAYKDMQVDHVKPFYIGGADTEDNFEPSCRACNYYKGCYHTKGFARELSKIPSRLEKNSFIFRLACQYGLITINNKPIIFYKDRINV